jgi:hypothetical protein
MNLGALFPFLPVCTASTGGWKPSTLLLQISAALIRRVRWDRASAQLFTHSWPIARAAVLSKIIRHASHPAAPLLDPTSDLPLFSNPAPPPAASERLAFDLMLPERQFEVPSLSLCSPVYTNPQEDW